MSCPVCGGQELNLEVVGYLEVYVCRDCGVTGYRFPQVAKVPSPLQKKLARWRERRAAERLKEVCREAQ